MKDTRRIKIIVAVNKEADSFYDKSKQLGTLAAEAFRGQQSSNKKEQHRAQMTGLENIAETTMKVSDVLDYIKKQTARQPGWQMLFDAEHLGDSLNLPLDYANKCFGEILKNYVENDLAQVREKICSSLGINQITDEDIQERQQVYLHLIRQLIRQLVVQYEYQIVEWERRRAAERAVEKR